MEVDKGHRCEVCNKKFTRSNNLKNPIQANYDKISLRFSCYLCRNIFKEQDKYLKHIGDHKEFLSFVIHKKLYSSSITTIPKVPSKFC